MDTLGEDFGPGGQRKPLEARQRARKQQVFHASACGQLGQQHYAILNDRLAAGKTPASAGAAANFLVGQQTGEFYLPTEGNNGNLPGDSFIQQLRKPSSKSNSGERRKFDNRNNKQDAYSIVCLRESCEPAGGDKVVVVARRADSRTSSNIIDNNINSQPIEQANSANGSLKSTCDSNASSGFSSAADSGGRPSNGFHATSGAGAGPFGSLKQQLGLRSKVIDDLDRLLTEATRGRARGLEGGSPTGSQLEGDSPARSLASRMFPTDPDATLGRAREVDYSTLCRDDFSSFISAGKCPVGGEQPPSPNCRQVVSPSGQQRDSIVDRCAQMDRPYGPTLIGVHESGSHSASNYSESPAASSESSESELGAELDEPDFLATGRDSEEATQSSSCLSPEPPDCSASPADEISSSIDRELLIGQQSHFRPVSPVEPPPTDLYATYTNRIEALLGLSRPDTSTSAAIAPTPIPRTRTPNCEPAKAKAEPRFIVKFRDKSQEIMEISQEIELVTDDDDDDAEPIVERVARKDNFEFILAAPQVTPRLNWDQAEAPAGPRALTRPEVAALEESLIERFACEERLVKAVKSQLGAFLETYQAASRCRATSGWQENWLFASKRPAGPPPPSPASKRSKTDDARLDLTKFSTLSVQTKAAKFKPPIDYVTGLAPSEPSDLATNLVESVYGAEADRMCQLRDVALESAGQPDVCRLLPSNPDEEEKEAETGSAPAKPLTVHYDASSLLRPTKNKTDKFSFSSYGYLFKCSKLRRASLVRRGLDSEARVENRILDKFQDLLTTDKLAVQERLAREGSLELERAKFLIGLTDVELFSAPRVIQFCSKISGSLPISVRWFRQEAAGRKWTEISGTGATGRLRLREASCLRPRFPTSSRWPMELCASFDYEYQTEAGSWFRFKRSGGDILFEIREPNRAVDLGQSYKCVLENYCSREECSFKLLDCSSRPSRNPVANPKVVGAGTQSGGVNKVNYNGKAILRTWSQRTLHKPRPSTTNLPLELRQESRPSDLDELSLRRARRAAGNDDQRHLMQTSDRNCANKAAGRNQQSLGQRSAQMLSSRDNFGDHFPYHPANLLKRLQANKFSSLTHRTLAKPAPKLSPAGGQTQKQPPSRSQEEAQAPHHLVPVDPERDGSWCESQSDFKNSFVPIAYQSEGKENDIDFRPPPAAHRQLL